MGGRSKLLPHPALPIGYRGAGGRISGGGGVYGGQHMARAVGERHGTDRRTRRTVLEVIPRRAKDLHTVFDGHTVVGAGGGGKYRHVVKAVGALPADGDGGGVVEGCRGRVVHQAVRAEVEPVRIHGGGGGQEVGVGKQVHGGGRGVVIAHCDSLGGGGDRRGDGVGAQ